MKATKSKIYFGTCSWKYDSWEGIVYSKAKGINMLEEYSRQFNSVEIDQWFWSLHAVNKISLPKESDVKLYAESVPENFRFTIKIPNSITLTHFYRKNKSEELKSNPHFLSPDLFDEFLSTLKPMKSRTGVLMFQFEYLNKEKMSNQIEFMDRFEAFLQNIRKEYQLGIEIRNPNYLNKKFFEFLKRNNISMVFLQGYYMPMIWEVFKTAKDFLIKPVVIRLHGPDRSGIEEKTGNVWNEIVEPKDEELTRIAEIINYLSEKQMDVYVNVNNHYEGCAPLTIKKLKEILSLI
ncbi:Hypothetical protein IALB_0467 [Ignavibacterium album JCM 16511]|uniref:DUF72 domain-containing protein n=1 Tax=Ignavibacterium album (strain DSM 19864 / JCM 16511 / NBRC 101810 / Mat9-16) TaxID=945713 RepID=I0AGS2_IGNAJ|nr:DUF72 domain-containing protein [Ignavibacterium album]AFH48179.1 Hypothetical protein IALB_0467 [Ignavibacterium album JCM 16511]